MDFRMPLLSVKDVEVSKKFYMELFDQIVSMDLGPNVTFSGGFAIQQGFAGLLGIGEESVIEKSHNMELYFEEKDFDAFQKKLEGYPGVLYVHKVKTYDWHQRVIRIYDPDKHIIEIGESMERIAQRFLREGKSIQEVSKIIMHPEEFVAYCQNKMQEEKIQ